MFILLLLEIRPRREQHVRQVRMKPDRLHSRKVPPVMGTVNGRCHAPVDVKMNNSLTALRKHEHGLTQSPTPAPTHYC